jgi:hypothetical protein
VSDFSDVCDAIATDLKSQVAAFQTNDDLEVHKYESWDPEELVADSKKHLAVWPVGEGAEAAGPLVSNAHELNQTFVALYWEPTGTDASRVVRDEDAAKALFNLHNAVRARFYVETNQMLAGSYRLWYSGASFPDRPGPVRWFAVAFTAARAQSFT